MKIPNSIVAFAIAISCKAQIITTIAGTDTSGYSGDGNLSVAAILNKPYKICLDNAGNILFSDCANHCIRKITSNGIITTIAGQGIAGFSGNGVPATSAKLNFPYSICVDATGNIFFADIGNARVRKIDVNGIITTVAGTGYQSYGGDGGLATSADLNGPSGVAVDAAGNVYIGDYLNHRIRKVDTSGIITTFAGTGFGGYTGDGGPASQADIDVPFDLCFDSIGNLYVADPQSNCVRKIDTSGIITTFAGNGTAGYGGDGGPANMAMFDASVDIEIDEFGNFFVTDMFNNRIRKIDASGIITTVVGNGSMGYSGDGGPALAAQLKWPAGTAVRAGKIYIADWRNERLRMVCQSLVTPSLSISDSVICPGNPFTLVASGAPSYTYSWGNGQSGTNNITLSSNSSGNYYVQAMDTNGCLGHSSVSLTVEGCVGIDEHHYKLDLVVYPNPVQSELFVKDPSLRESSCRISILNQLGQVVKTEHTEKSVDRVYQADVSGLDNGFYVVLLETPTGTKRSSFTKQK